MFKHTIGAVKAVDGVSFAIDAGRDVRPGGGERLRQVDHRPGRPPPDRATSGSVRFEGEDVTTADPTRLRQLRRQMQMIFQDPYASLNPRMTVRTILSEPFKIHGLPEDGRVDELLDAGGPVARARQPLPARVLRRPAPAGRHRPGPRPRPQAGGLRRAGVGPRRLHPGPGPQPAGGPPGQARADLPVHRPRPERRPPHRRRGGGDVPGLDRGGGRPGRAVRAGVAPLHPGPDLVGAGARPDPGAQPPAHPRHRRPAQPGQPAQRVPVPHPVPQVRQRAVGGRAPAVRRRAARPGGAGRERRPPVGLPLRRGPASWSSARRPATAAGRPGRLLFAGHSNGEVRTTASRHIGVSLSGGGHRASLFGLGALIYLVDAGKGPEISCVSSVSGGSITNGWVGLKTDLFVAASGDFRTDVAPLAAAVSTRGTLWRAPLTYAYLALMVAVLAVATVLCFPLEGAWPLWRCGSWPWPWSGWLARQRGWVAAQALRPGPVPRGRARAGSTPTPTTSSAPATCRRRRASSSRDGSSTRYRLGWGEPGRPAPGPGRAGLGLPAGGLRPGGAAHRAAPLLPGRGGRRPPHPPAPHRRRRLRQHGHRVAAATSGPGPGRARRPNRRPTRSTRWWW